MGTSDLTAADTALGAAGAGTDSVHAVPELEVGQLRSHQGDVSLDG